MRERERLARREGENLVKQVEDRYRGSQVDVRVRRIQSQVNQRYEQYTSRPPSNAKFSGFFLNNQVEIWRRLRCAKYVR